MQLIACQQAELLGQAGAENIEDTIRKLMILIGQRQVIMEEIDQAQQLAAREQAQPDLAGCAAALMDAVKMEEAAIFQSILAIQSCDRRSAVHAERLLQSAGAEANQARKNLMALKSYTGLAQYSDSQFFDGYK